MIQQLAAAHIYDTILKINRYQNAAMPEECRYLAVIRIEHLVTFYSMGPSAEAAFESAANQAVAYLWKLSRGSSVPSLGSNWMAEVRILVGCLFVKSLYLPFVFLLQSIPTYYYTSRLAIFTMKQRMYFD